MSGYPEGSREFTRLLGPGVGYDFIVGVGAFFALGMILLARLQKRFAILTLNTANEFATVSRSIKPGLVIRLQCCQCMDMNATLLQSSAATYLNGLSAAWWYGMGGTIQICFFAAVAAKVKQNANGAVTFLEIAQVILFVILYIFLFTIYGTSSAVGSPGKLWDLLQDAAVLAPVDGNTGGSYTTMKSNGGIFFAGTTMASGFSGVLCDQGYWQRAIASRPESTTKAYMLSGIAWFTIPFSFGTVLGLTSCALLTNVKFPTFPYVLSNSEISAGLVALAAAVTVMGKAGAAAVLLVVFMAATFACSAGLIAVSSIVMRDIIGIWRPHSGTKVRKFGSSSLSLFSDSQMVMASHIAIVVFAVWLGAWSCILHVASINLGEPSALHGLLLLSSGLTHVKFPTFPYVLSNSEISAGLVALAAAATVMGKAGAAAVLLVVFMAATSACSAGLIAVSSIVTRDIIGIWCPHSGTKMVMASHITIVVFAVWLGAWSCILHVASIDLGWLFYVQGVLLTPAVVPVAFTVSWKKQSKHAAFWSTIFGTSCSLVGWMIGCKKTYGEINITNLALPYSALSGASPGLVMSALATLTISLIFPDNYDFQGTRAIALSDFDTPSTGKVTHGDSSVDLQNSLEKKDKPTVNTFDAATVNCAHVVELVTAPALEESANDLALNRAVLQRVFVCAGIISGIFSLVICFVILILMFAAYNIFSRRFFEVWIGLSITWTLILGAVCCVLPLWESRYEIAGLVQSTVHLLGGHTLKGRQMA
ncbi:hypothetical protein JCM10213v2_000147 [Rhodosporidiobolus nylandii]